MPQIEEAELDVTESEFDELVAEIEQKAARVRAQLLKVEAEREELTARLRRYDGAIARLKPQPKKTGSSKPTYNPSGRTQEEAVTFTQTYLSRHAKELADGFTFSELHRRMNANGEGRYGKERIRYAVVELHERGVVRLDRKTVGGGKLFKLVNGDG